MTQGMTPHPALQAALPQPGATIAGRYIVEREIGRGGMGAVFVARHNVTGRRVAIKWLLPGFADGEQAVARFLREAQLAASVDHENVVDIYDVGRDESGFYLVMEFLKGRSLADRLAEGPMSVRELVDVMRGVCAGLAAAHLTGVIHRDLKPENIFLAEARNQQGGVVPKLVDFGVSKTLVTGESYVRLTGTNVAMGTPYYMSPEQIRSAADVGIEADIYSLGVIAYEALAGVLPFVGDSVAAIILKVGMEKEAPIQTHCPDLPAHVANAVHRALSKDAQQRFPSAGAFYAALAEGFDVVSYQSFPHPAQPHTASQTRAVIGGAGVGLLALAVVLGGGFMSWSQRDVSAHIDGRGGSGPGGGAPAHGTPGTPQPGVEGAGGTQHRASLSLADAVRPIAAPPRCRDGQVLIPGTGTEAAGSGPFCLDRTEVSIAAFREANNCASTGSCAALPTEAGCTSDEGLDLASGVPVLDRPVSCVPYNAAVAYCARLGESCRLPSAAEWERVASAAGPTAAFRVFAVNAPADSANTFGLLHTQDNLREWVAGDEQRDGLRPIRGDGWFRREADPRFESTLADAARPASDVGFRCACGVPMGDEG
ncbi:MAG: protein kinase [Sandaracinaceae bacterium]|nr:protein kinase [Sandaracinaceae bacterium]